MIPPNHAQSLHHRRRIERAEIGHPLPLDPPHLRAGTDRADLLGPRRRWKETEQEIKRQACDDHKRSR